MTENESYNQHRLRRNATSCPMLGHVAGKRWTGHIARSFAVRSGILRRSARPGRAEPGPGQTGPGKGLGVGRDGPGWLTLRSTAFRLH